MPAYLLGRFISLALSLLAASVVIFLLIEIVPGDPAQFMLGLNATPELADALRDQLGLNGSPVDAFRSREATLPPMMPVRR